MLAHAIANSNKVSRDKIKGAVMPKKFKKMVANTTPSAMLLLGNKIMDEI